MPDFGDRIRKRRMHHPAGAAHTAGHRCDVERTGLHAGGAMFRAALFMLLITLAGAGHAGPATPGEPAREAQVTAAMALPDGLRQAPPALGLDTAPETHHLRRPVVFLAPRTRLAPPHLQQTPPL